MNRLELTARIIRKQMRNIKHIVTGHPVSTHSLGSTTLDQDDVDLANRFLKDHSQWENEGIIKDYELQFSNWNGSKYAYSFMGARVALSAVIYGLEIHPGDEVIIPGYTCIVVPNAFQYAGIKTVYADIELDTFGIDASTIKDRITEKTRAILLHHLYGLVARDYEAVLNIAHEHGLFVIEDCAQSTGAEFKGKKVGNFGDAAIYSSEQSKVFNTLQGGVATTNDECIALRINDYQKTAPYPDQSRIERQLKNLILNYYVYKHPQRWFMGDMSNIWYGDIKITTTTEEEVRGIRPAYYGEKMPAPIAALGLNQLKKIDYYNDRRRRTSSIWDEWCTKYGYDKPYILSGSTPIFLRYPVLVEPEKKQDKIWAQRNLGVELGVWYLGNIHPLRNTFLNECPNANIAVRQCINFPGLINETITI